MEKEIWLPITNDIIPNISNTYYVSNYGRIYTTYRNKICKPKNNNTIELALINGNIIASISRIVYKVFIDNNIPNNYIVYFKDNNADNLYYKNLYLISKADYKQLMFNNNALLNANLTDHEISNSDYYRAGIIDIIHRTDETWNDILDSNVPNIKPWYKISNYGRVFNKATGCLVRTSIINSGYIRVQLRNNDNKKIDLLVHRVELMAFNPIANQYEMEVNHKDLNTFNNYIGNLEWVTPSDNLNYHPDEYMTDNYNEILSIEEVNKICQALQNNMSYKYICFYVLNRNYTGTMHKRIYKIHKRKIFTDISCKYNF